MQGSHSGEKGKQKPTCEKGVNITVDTFRVGSDKISSQKINEFSSIVKVGEQIKDAIDTLSVMGTPPSSSVGDVDNEESVIAETSIYSSVYQVKHINQKIETSSCMTNSSPRDLSEVSNVQGPCCKNRPSGFRTSNQDTHVTGQPIYVPAILPPAVLCMNPSCACTHSLGYMQNQIPHPSFYKNNNNEDRNINLAQQNSTKTKLSTIFQKLTQTKPRDASYKELYKINIKRTKEHNLPKRFVFDLVSNSPKSNAPKNDSDNLKRPIYPHDPRHCPCSPTKIHQNDCYYHPKGITIEPTFTAPSHVCRQEHPLHHKNPLEPGPVDIDNNQECSKVDVYYFDHGNAAYYKTTDSPPLIFTEIVAERAETYAAKFWAEVFGMLYIACAFVTTFVLQFFRFLLHSVIRPLTIGLLQLSADYFFKPLLATCFNAVLQPILIFIYNAMTSIRDLLEPVAEGIGYFFREAAVCLKAIRLFEIKQDKRKCDKKSQCSNDKNAANANVAELACDCK